MSKMLRIILESTEALIATFRWIRAIGSIGKFTVMEAPSGGGGPVNSVTNTPPKEMSVIFPLIVSPICVTVQGMDTS